MSGAGNEPVHRRIAHLQVMTTHLRVAFFPDAFEETNGVARTSRALASAAAKRSIPFLCVHGGPGTRSWDEGPGRRLQIRRGPVSFSLEHDLRHDLLLWRDDIRVERGDRVEHVRRVPSPGQATSDNSGRTSRIA